MKKWIFPLLFSFSVFATEQEVQFTYLGTEEDYEAYYACSYAKEMAEKYLKIMGVTDIEVLCTGGLRGPYDWQDPLKLTASFNYPSVTQSQVQTVEIKSDYLFTACAMNTRMIKKFIEAIPNISVVEKRDRCGDPKNPFYFKLNIQR